MYRNPIRSLFWRSYERYSDEMVRFAPMRRIWIAGVLLFLLALGGIAARYYWAPRRTPAGQPPLANLSLSAFQQAFNDDAGQIRVILLLSPT